jgi:hypothetical protein
MSAPFFESAWKRAKRTRDQHPLLKSGRLHPPPLEPSEIDPTRFKAHPAQIYEHVLLTLDEDQFRALAPEEDQLKADQPAETGIAWIDELERKLYEKRE